jgi:pyruvate formate lyase activating enzyme
VPVEIRMPIVPGWNDAPEEIEAAAKLVATLKSVTVVRLLAYHRLAGSKYVNLGLDNSMPDVDAPSRDQLERIATRMRAHGVTVRIPGD